MRPSAARLRELLDYDPGTGVLRWKHNGKSVGSRNSRGYIRLAVKGYHTCAHRVAWAMQTGEWSERYLDHIDCDPSNNRWANLRQATHSQNSMNRHVRRDSDTGVKGVRLRRGKYAQAYIQAAGERIYLGSFASVEEAMAARGRAAAGLHKEFAREGEDAQPATVPVPPPVPRTPNVHVAQVATKPNFVVLEGTWPFLTGLLTVLVGARPRLV